jgi:hypothetical protein
MHLLDDDALARFLRDGYVTLDAGLPPEFHQALYDQVEEVFANEGNPGNNILPRVPEIRQVLDSPSVSGALNRILGANYYLHAHRFCHDRPANTDAQGLHKDSWSRLHHRTRWCMAFYYPQDTTVDMGPTGIVPGSQYYNTKPADGEVALAGAAGTVTIVHYDLWHRGLANTSDRRRFMLKFLFTRLQEPESSSANVESGFDPDDPSAPLWREMWRWHTGAPATPGQSLSTADAGTLTRQLGADDETTCFHAAYRLGESGAVDALVDALRAHHERARRNAGYGLSAAGADAVPALVDCLTDKDAEVRSAAVESLADMGTLAMAAKPALDETIADPDLEVRRRAAYALGTTGITEPTTALIQGLADEDEWVARNCALSLARVGAGAGEAVPALGQALSHPNRYVQANALKALERIDDDASRRLLYDHMATARWCPITSNTTPF